MADTQAVGVLLESGAQDWQIFQQDRSGWATVHLRGRWVTQNPFKQAAVWLRVLREDAFEAVSDRLDWGPATTTAADGKWSAALKLPKGGLYRIETILQFDGGPIEWGQRGDMVHHVGVGDVWVITGQSNAAGYGKSPVADAPELGVHLFHADGRWKLATHPLGDSTNTHYPLNREGANASHSPWLAFGRRLKAVLGHPIGLIPASLGGSPMVNWDRHDNGCLFENMQRYVADAGGRVRGVVWYQGESDCGEEQLKLYGKRFRRFVCDLRVSFKDRTLPVITAQLNRYIGEPRTGPGHRLWERMRELQRQLAHEIPHVFIISLFDAALSDGIHNSSTGNLLIGERMANTALGGVHGLDVGYRHPECVKAKRLPPASIELTFVNIRTRLHYENNIPQELPFAVRDTQGDVPLEGYGIPARDRFVLKLARPLAGRATVTGAPSANPPPVVPFDLSGYRPMLAFTLAVES